MAADHRRYGDICTQALSKTLKFEIGLLGDWPQTGYFHPRKYVDRGHFRLCKVTVEHT